MFLRAGQPEKEPGVMVSHILLDDDRRQNGDRRRRNKQAVKIIMNGCNMGIESITEALHQCKDASSESIPRSKETYQNGRESAG